MSDVRFNLGNLHFHEKRYEAAISCYVTYMVREGDSSRAHRNIGKSLLKLGQLDSAIQSFKRAVELDPKGGKNYYSIALIYEMKDEIEEALSHFKRALELNPEHVEARYHLAKILRRKGRIQEAMAEFHTLLKYAPDHHQGLNGLATCYINLKDCVEAVGLLRHAVTVYPTTLWLTIISGSHSSKWRISMQLWSSFRRQHVWIRQIRPQRSS